MKPGSLCLAMALMLTCQPGERQAPGSSDSIPKIETREEALARFRTGLDSVDTLTPTVSSRDELVRRFIQALSESDTTTLTRLVVTRAEFAYLYYPTTPQGLPPYDLPADLLWFLLEERSGQGLGKALDRFGGHRLTLTGYRCDPEPSPEGENRVWGPCVVSFRDGDAPPDSLRLFSQILEREGRFKFLNYSNRLD